MNRDRLLSPLEESSEAVERLREELNKLEDRKEEIASKNGRYPAKH